MCSAADIFGEVLDNIQLPFPTQQRGGDLSVGASITEALEHQAGVAERLREQQDSEHVAAEPSDIGDSASSAALLTEEAALLLQSTAPTVSGEGPLALARALARAATLNADQMGVGPFLANSMPMGTATPWPSNEVIAVARPLRVRMGAKSWPGCASSCCADSLETAF